MTNEEELLEQQEDTQKGKYLTFNLGKEFFGIEISHVIEIAGMQPITPIPQVPDFIKGIINLRGKVISIMDMRLKFGKEEAVYNERSCIIVIAVQDISFGLVVDNVAEVLSIADADIMPPPDLKTGFCNQYINGIATSDEGIILLLDCLKLLSDSEFSLFSA